MPRSLVDADQHLPDDRSVPRSTFEALYPRWAAARCLDHLWTRTEFRTADFRALALGTLSVPTQGGGEGEFIGLLFNPTPSTTRDEVKADDGFATMSFVHLRFCLGRNYEMASNVLDRKQS